MSLAVLPSPFLPGTAFASLLKAFTLHGVHATLTDPTLGHGDVAETLIERWVETTQDVDVLVA